jgi:hypothetical protein
MASEVVVVEAWHDALNAGDVNWLASLVSDDIEVGGSRGSGRGIALLREWVDRAGIHMEPLRIFHRDETVVVEQDAVWRSPETGETGSTQIVATVFTIRNDLIDSIMRYNDLDTALQLTGLTMDDEIEEGV